MSVIFGIKEGNKITIAGDKRGSAKDGSFLTDSLNKITIVNEHLAFVSAGNAAIETAIRMDIDKIGGKDKITTDDLLGIIKKFYQSVKVNRASGILAMPFCFMIAGKSQDNGASLISGCNSKGNLESSEVPMALYPPVDVGMEQCCDLFARNYKFNHSEFVERTIREISRMSQVVSATGDKWIFDTSTGKGILHSF